MCDSKLDTIARWIVAVYVGALILGPAGLGLFLTPSGRSAWPQLLLSVFVAGLVSGFIAGQGRGIWAALLALLWMCPILSLRVLPAGTIVAGGALGGWLESQRKTVRTTTSKGWRIAGGMCVFLFLYSLTAGRFTALHILEMHRRVHHPYAERERLVVYPAGAYICVRDAPPLFAGRLCGRDITYYFDPTGLVKVGERTIYY